MVQRRKIEVNGQDGKELTHGRAFPRLAMDHQNRPHVTYTFQCHPKQTAFTTLLTASLHSYGQLRS